MRDYSNPYTVATHRHNWLWVYWDIYAEGEDEVSRRLPLSRNPRTFGVAHTHWGARWAGRRAAKRMAEHSKPSPLQDQRA